VIRRTKAKDRDDDGRTKSLADQRFGKAPPPERGWEAKRELLGWSPSCNCSTVEAVPCRLLDPFCGSGSMGLIAKELGLDFVGVDLSEFYCDMARKRIREFDPDR
jgi:SAM-dependent methyltransferase